MFFSKTSAAIVALVAASTARAAEGIHLINCGNNDYSAVLYCVDDSNCNFIPSSSNICYPRGGPSGGTITWETYPSWQSCGFSTGVGFDWNINTDAQSKDNFSEVGVGKNTYNYYRIHKDDKHVMFYDNTGKACRTIYYTVPY